MYIAIDVGGTKTAFAKIDKLDKPTIGGKEIISTPQNYDEAIEQIFIQVEKFSKWGEVQGISIALPGSVSNEKIELLTNLPDWNHKPLLADVSKKFNTKVIMRNDAVATARAERYFGLAKNENRYLYCIIGLSLIHISMSTR